MLRGIPPKFSKIRVGEKENVWVWYRGQESYMTQDVTVVRGTGKLKHIKISPPSFELSETN